MPFEIDHQLKESDKKEESDEEIVNVKTYIDELGDVNIETETIGYGCHYSDHKIKYTGKRLHIHLLYKELRDEMNICTKISVLKYNEIMKYLNDNKLQLNKENIRKYVLSSGSVKFWKDYDSE